MSTTRILPAFPTFHDSSGRELEAGYVYIGEANLDPTENPITVYWDQAMSVEARQPIRTVAGYPSNDGVISNIYVASNYSIEVQNRNRVEVYASPNDTDFYSGGLASVSSYTELAALTGLATGSLVRVNSGTGIDGLFRYDSSRSGDNDGGTVIDGWVRQYVGNIQIKWFGIDGTGSTNGTASFSSAIDVAAGTAIDLVKDEVYLIDPISITTNFHLNGKNSKILLTGTTGFNLRADVDRFEIYDVEFDNQIAPSGVIGYEAINMQEYVGASTDFPSGQEYSASYLSLKNCIFNHLKVTLSGALTIPYVEECIWGNEGTIKVSPTYFLAATGTNDFDNPTVGGLLKNCRFLDAWPDDGNNQDIIKITGSRSGFEVSGNIIRNANVDAVAQIDFYTGNDKALFSNNVVYNAQVNRKETGGVIISTDFDLIIDNHFVIEDGHTLIDHLILARGSFFQVKGNSFSFEDDTTPITAVIVEQETENVPPIPSDEGFGIIISENIFDFTNAHPSSFPFQAQSGDVAGGGTIYSKNIQYLGARMALVGANSIVSDNIWRDTTNAASVSINGTASGFGYANGNVASLEGSATIQNLKTGKNPGFEVAGTPTVGGGGTIDADQNDFVFVNGTGNVSISGGKLGDVLEIACSGGSPNFVHTGSTLVLAGSSDFLMDFNDTLTLKKTSTTRWNEMARMQD